MTAQPIQVPGGALDPAYPDEDIYLETPLAAAALPGAACRMALNYITYATQGRFADMAALFAEDAVVLDPFRRNSRGGEQIREFYTKFISGVEPALIPVAFTASAHECFVEIAVGITLDGKPRYKLGGTNHFTINEAGKATRMLAYVRFPKNAIESLTVNLRS